MDNEQTMNTKYIAKYEVKGNGKQANELTMIQNNLKMMKDPHGQLKTAYNHKPAMWQLLKTINTLMFYQGEQVVKGGHLALESNACDLYKACGKRFILKYSVQATNNLLNLLCIAGAIKVLSWNDLNCREKWSVKEKHTYYQVLDLNEADFSRISSMDYNTRLNYATVATAYGKELADNTFSNINTRTKREAFDEVGLERFVEMIVKRGVVSYQDAINLLKQTQVIDYKDGWYGTSLRALFIMKYFQGRLKLTTYKRSGGESLDLDPCAKVITPAKKFASACF